MTKPVALSDQTYRRLKCRKRPGESFSEAIERILKGQRKDPLLFAENVPKSRIPASRRLDLIERERDASLEDA